MSIYAYRKVLVKRFLDYAALTIRAGCVLDTCSGIRERLRQIPAEQPNFVDLHLAENKSDRMKREQLQRTKDRLEKIDAILADGVGDLHGTSTFVADLAPMENSTSMSLDQLGENLARTTASDNDKNGYR